MNTFSFDSKILIAKLLRASFIVGLSNFLSVETYADATWGYAVEASASVQTSPPQITLSWPINDVFSPTDFIVYRKGRNDTSWGSGTSLPGSASTFTDNNVSVGSAYEYQIVKHTSGYTGYGYVYAGISVPLVESRGKLILLVDNRFSSALVTELSQLQADLIGDGYSVIRHDVSSTDSVTNIKSIIQNDYYADTANVKTLFLFGHIPVPYSGDLNPDGHAEHLGAWPADVYYGDMNGVWTDYSVSDSLGTDVRNHNIPGDGKFDQSFIPSGVELRVGRVDFANMPGRLVYGGPATFPSELELLRKYLNKDHAFRTKNLTAPARALIFDEFGDFGGQAFVASAYRNFASLLGASTIQTLQALGTFIPTLASNSFLWAHGSGSGSFSSIGGIGSGLYNTGTTIDIVSADIKAIFTTLFGSWLGDWDSEDNIMRAVLTTSMGLTSSWSGRPHWFYHTMGLGEPIGESARLTQNNSNGLYQTQINQAAGEVHIALMGDPALRMHIVAPVTNLTGSMSGSGVSLNWNPSSDSVLGYYVYRSQNSGPYSRITNSFLNTNSFTDSSVTSGTYSYMVRAVRLENSASGTYYNASDGVFYNTNGSSLGSGTGINPPPPPPPGNGTLSISSDRTVMIEGSYIPTNITITRTGSTASDLPVSYAFSGTATTWDDYRTPQGNMPNSMTIPAGSASVTMSIIAPQQSGPKYLTLTLNPVTNYTFAAASVTVQLMSKVVVISPSSPSPSPSPSPTPTAAATLSISSDQAAISEGSNVPANITITRTGSTANAMLVRYAFSGTAATWDDYRTSQGTMPDSMTIPAGSASVTMSIIAPRHIGSRYFTLTLYPVANFSITSGSVTVQLVDGVVVTGGSSVITTGPMTVSISSDQSTISESGSTPANITISRTGNNSAALTVQYSFSGTAATWDDYRQAQGNMPDSVVIPAGASSVSMAIFATSHVGPRYFTLTLRPNANFSIGTASATVQLVN
ncbi:MAG: hypothetical protein JWQ35_968 [Bacteriovoracaceae bacterium]|nr:hypothetical protein [Bacteriovoracaceae bacterium]